MPAEQIEAFRTNGIGRVDDLLTELDLSGLIAAGHRRSAVLAVSPRPS